MSPITTTKNESNGEGLGLYVALVPWVVFTALVAHSSLKLGSVAALVVSAVVALPGLRSGKPKLLELGAVATFAGFVLVAFAADATTGHDIARYARGIAAGALALLAFASLLFVPFTEQYARDKAPKAVWGTPRFKAVNHKLTTMWGLIFAAMVPFHIAAGAINTQRTNLILNWVVPILLVMWGVKRSTAAAEDNAARAGHVPA
jgi:hypothetical protein